MWPWPPWLAGGLALLLQPPVATAQVCDDANHSNMSCAFAGEWRQELDLTYRTPETFIPVRYDVTIAFFNGTGDSRHERSVVKIDFKLKRPTNKIILNAAKLNNIKTNRFSCSRNGKSFKPSITSMDISSSHETVTVKVMEEIREGSECRLELSYSYLINCKPGHEVGFYNVLEDGVLLVTQGQDMFARRMFPCLDRASQKAVFRTHVLTTSSLAKRVVALANGAQKSERPVRGLSGYVRISFEPTPKMSPYLWALMIGDKDQLRFYRDPQGRVLSFGKAANYTEARLKEMADRVAASHSAVYSLFKSTPLPDPIPVPKIGVVNRFYLAAMENWGLIMGAPLGMSPETITHETCHSLFGNLVTMADFRYFWLNEGMNDYFTSRTVGILDGEEAMMKMKMGSFLQSQVMTKLWKGLRGGVLALENGEYLRRKDCSFPYVYSAGRAILRMIESVIGDEAFLYGVGRYLQENAFSAVTSYDFIHAMMEAIDKFDVSGGFPSHSRTHLMRWLRQVIQEPMDGLLISGSKVLDVDGTPTILLKHSCHQNETIMFAEKCRAGTMMVPIIYKTSDSPSLGIKWLTPSTKTVKIAAKDLTLNPECRSYILLDYEGPEFNGRCHNATRTAMNIIAGKVNVKARTSRKK